MNDISNILRLHSEPLQDSWLDAYGHLNEAYYLVAFSNATWALQKHFAIGTDYFDQTGAALYTVESHVRYLKEVRAPATLEIHSMVLGVHAKRLRIAHVMTVDDIERATFECLLLHFDSRAAKTSALPENVQAALHEATVLKLPDWAGRSVSL